MLLHATIMLEAAVMQPENLLRKFDAEAVLSQSLRRTLTDSQAAFQDTAAGKDKGLRTLSHRSTLTDSQAAFQDTAPGKDSRTLSHRSTLTDSLAAFQDTAAGKDSHRSTTKSKT